MSNINRVELSGNLTRDPELKVTQGGTPVLRFGIAVGEKRNEKDYTNFFDCIIWGKYGEVMQKYLQKGQRVALAGSLHYSSWNDPKTGYTKSRIEVYVRDIGTAAELAERFGVTVKTVRWWASPAAKRRDNGKHKVAERI